MTLNEFEQHTCSFQYAVDRDLETYLLALLNLVTHNKNKAATPELLLELLASAFTATPATLDNTWLEIKSAPETSVESANPDTYRTSNPIPSADPKAVPDLFAGHGFDGIDYTISVLQFQVAELYKMRGKQLTDKWRTMGIDSETGNRWYNFDPKSIISCGLQYFLDTAEEETPFEVDWATLGQLLEMGRIYE